MDGDFWLDPEELHNATHEAEGYNPLCGDKIKVYLQIEDGVVTDISFVAAGCAISKASASLMVEGVKGKAIEEADRLFQSAHRMFTRDGEVDPNDTETLGKIVALSGVSKFPMRVKCATMAWHTLVAA